jgi:hypothetical protein
MTKKKNVKSSVLVDGAFSGLIPAPRLCLSGIKTVFVSILLICSALSMPQCFADERVVEFRKNSLKAYDESPFSLSSKDYFARFNRDKTISPSQDEVLIENDWQIVYPADAKPLTVLMAGYLSQFLNERMEVSVSIQNKDHRQITNVVRAITLFENGGGNPEISESFTIDAREDSISIAGTDSNGLRDGIVKMVSLIGLKQSPILSVGREVYTPRVPVRVGTVPWMGSYRDLLFRGLNSVMITGCLKENEFGRLSEEIGSVYKLSKSKAIPELVGRQQPEVLSLLKKSAQEADSHGLGVYIYLHFTPRVSADDPVLLNHPEIRGALINDGPPYNKYHLCTSHPLVRRYLSETVTGIMEEIPYIKGILIIVGGEGFLHCFMRPYDVKPGCDTNCERCSELGLETVVSNLCDYIGDSARQINPETEVLAWPYSSVYYWPNRKEDREQLKLIEALKPGTALFTNVVKDDYIEKPGGIRKLLWDYSIDEPGPGQRARNQIQACHRLNRKIYIHTEPELAFEASRMPYIPAMDKWALRAENLAYSGTDGAFIVPAFRPDFGTTSGDVFQYFWWEPSDPVEKVLEQLAGRIVGSKNATQLRMAWKHVSDAVSCSPVLDEYLSGPMYLGPAHPMCADVNYELPDGFYGVFKYPVKTGVLDSQVNSGLLFAEYYRKMEQAAYKAVQCIGNIQGSVASEYKLTYESQRVAIRWLYHTARTSANLYESFSLRDKLLAALNSRTAGAVEIDQLRLDYQKWMNIMIDEKQNAQEALPLMQADIRLDFYYGYYGDKPWPHRHGVEMIADKLEILEYEINEYLPSVARDMGILESI